jgi:glycosyltransferase involved in cell wall biosynthesis
MEWIGLKRMKRILLDIYKVKDPYTGLGQFSMQLGRHLVEMAEPDLEYTFLKPEGTVLPTWADKVPQIQATWKHRYLPQFMPRYDLWHSLQQFPSYLPGKKTRQILTIHDLNFLEEKKGAKAAHYLKKLQRHVDRADAVTAISHYTAGQISLHLQLNGKAVYTIYNGVEVKAFPEAQRPAYVSGKPFFFAIGVFKEKKNWEALVPMMRHFDDHSLILAGNHDTAYGRKIREMVSRLGLEDRIIMPGKISDAGKYWLYQHCEALLFPSLAEGFGLPAVEAMLMGKPVFLSCVTSLPEIGGDAAFYFDGFDPAQMAALIREKLQEFAGDRKGFSVRLRAQAEQFNWARAAKTYVQLYREVMS